jgi:6-phosphogluconolactonase
MNGTVSVLADAAELALAAARHFAQLSQAAIEAKNRFSVALSGGETPRATYQLLASEEFRRQIDWKHVHLFWGDERCVPPDHPDSNYGMARRSLIDDVPIPADNIHRILGEYDPVVAAESYEADLKDHFKSPLPAFDLILLGLGADGHVASLFPDSAALEEKARLAVAVQHPQSNLWRVTLTLPVINGAAHVNVLVEGAEKAPMIQLLQQPSASVPATRVRATNGELHWFLDSSAAKNLT